MSFVLKGLLAIWLATSLFGSAAHADSYRPDEFLSLNLGQAVLSPKPIGPPAQFEPLPVEAKGDAVVAGPAVKAAQAVRPLQRRRKVAVARHNPLDAQASDTRIQVWPCRSGALCTWKR